MGSYWGSGVLMPIVEKVYARIPSEYVYDGSKNAGEDNYNLDTYGNPIFYESQSTGSYAFNANYLMLSCRNAGNVTFITTNPPSEQHKYLIIEIPSQAGGFAYLMYNGEHEITLDNNRKFTLDISNIGLYPVGVRLKNVTANATSSMQISKIYFSD